MDEHLSKSTSLYLSPSNDTFEGNEEETSHLPNLSQMYMSGMYLFADLI